MKIHNSGCPFEGRAEKARNQRNSAWTRQTEVLDQQPVVTHEERPRGQSRPKWRNGTEVCHGSRGVEDTGMVFMAGRHYDVLF